MTTYKFKLYRSKQNKYIGNLLNIACEIYNVALAYKKKLYEEQKISLKKGELYKYISTLRNSEEFKHWKCLGSQVVQQISDRIYAGYNLFFINLANKKKNKSKRTINPPGFKKKYKYRSITFKQNNKGFKLLKDNKIRIEDKIFKFFKSREILGRIKTLTVKRNNIGEYFIFIVTDHVKKFEKSKESSGKMVGFDFGFKQFLTGSDGNNIDSPEYFKQNKRKIAKLNRKLSLKKKGSKNRKRARINLARFHEDIANKRNNFHWQLANDLAKKYDIIFIEGLNLDGMKRIFGKKISDLGFGDFIRILDYKMSINAKKLIKIDRWFPSSKTCSNCGEINDNLQLRDREWTCSKCGIKHRRDFNASINIENEGKRILAAANATATQVVGTSTIDKTLTISLDPSSLLMQS